MHPRTEADLTSALATFEAMKRDTSIVSIDRTFVAHDKEGQTLLAYISRRPQGRKSENHTATGKANDQPPERTRSHGLFGLHVSIDQVED